MAYPIVKWAGGKRQLLPAIRKRMPVTYNKYYEPFIGGGALFFDLSPKKSVINDFNSQLINVYKQIQVVPEDVINKLQKLQDSYNSFSSDEERVDYFFKQREAFNYFIINDLYTVDSAALFIFLNKGGYNGLYRINSKGLFNVPSAHRKVLNAFDKANIFDASKALKSCKILNKDFEEACKNVKKGDFVFFDSPYYNTFDNYQVGGFSENDHYRLAELYKKLTEKGAFCILTNNDCDFIKDLYSEYIIDVILVKRMINCNSNNRVGSEVIITNYLKRRV